MDEKQTGLKQIISETGFLLDSIQELPEMKAVLYRMHFEKNGAKLMWLDRREENQTFAIAFKTLPSDDTGVFHILEHSLLCGSEKYPVSKPFVEMIKSSLQTFMNAFTFPDKTMYPLCSRNRKDFLNLTDVYLDAVFHPLCVTRKEIFLQEGWHYELEDPEGELTCNGVVYNEMKGMYASPDTLIDSHLNRLLFPDNCYRFQSGGDPQHIVELDYDEYVAEYQKFYHPSNACVILDGDIDIKAVLMKIGKVFNEYDRQETDCEIGIQKPVQPEEYQCPYEVGGNEETDNKVILAGGWVYGKYDEPEKNMACSLLADILCSTNESPLRKAVLTKGLAENVELAKMDGIQQPYLVMVIRNTSEEKRKEVWKTISGTLTDLAEHGMDHKRLEAALSRMEFQMREKESGMYPEGIVNAMRILESSLYGGNPAQNLCYGKIFESLKAKISQGYFERLLKETLIENPHCAKLTLYPSKTIGEERRRREQIRFQEIKDLWLQIKREQVVEELSWLRRIQGTPDSPKELAALPQLALSDISEEIEEIPQNITEFDGSTVLLHPLETEGIIHISYYFSLSDFPLEELSVISFLRMLLGQTGTEHYSALELQAELEGNLGRFQPYVDVAARRGQTETCTPCLVIQASVLKKKISEAVRLLNEVLNGSQFHDLQYVRTRIRQLRMSMEQHVLMNGNTYAAGLAVAGFSAEGAVQEAFQGIRMLRWVQRMDDNFEKEGEGLVQKLKQFCEKIFVRCRMTLGITGEIEESWIRELIRLLADRRGRIGTLAEYFRPEEACPSGKIGIRIPAEIGFAGKGANLNICSAKYHGAMKVAARILSYGYLWETIRVKGGAYGTGLTVSGNGNVVFTSFRDPNGADSLASFDKSGTALRRLCKSGESLDRYIISTIASTEPLMSARQKGIQAAKDYLCGVTREMHCIERRDLPTLYYIAEALKTISSYNIWLMVSAFLLFPIKILYMVFIGRMQFRTQAGVYQEIGGLTAYLAERVRNLSLIKTYTNEEKELKNGENAAYSLFHANMRVKKLECTVTALTTLIGMAQVMIVMVFGVVLLKRGDIDIQQWVAFYMFSGTLSTAFSNLLEYWANLKMIQGTTARTARLLTAPEEEETVKDTKEPESAEVTFSHVSFSYGDKKALEDISFHVPAGSSTAIIGLCGSGKTTSVSLLEHFYEPCEGEITFGKVPVSEMSLDLLRGSMGYVQQGADIFSGTAREALTYGLHRKVEDEEIWEAAEKTGFAEVLRKWEDGLNASVAPGGTSMSGGQRQKLVLTREFMRKSGMILLDEPTSALDVTASKMIQDTIFEMFPGRTKIIITHDLSLLERVDQIVVLNKGVLAGCGSYGELYGNCQAFMELIAACETEKEAVQ